MDKASLISQVITQLEKDLAALKHAAAETHSASTGDESKQEGKYDTRGLEASYLADAQAEQAVLLEKNIQRIISMPIEDKEDDPIASGSDIILSGEEDDQHFFMLIAGGGITLQPLQSGEASATVITPESPLGELLIGKQVGNYLTTEQLGEVFVSEIY